MSLSILNLPKENACGCSDLESVTNTECMCPATGLVQIIGRKYSMRLLTVIGEHQSIRFNDLQIAMDDMSSSTLTIRLNELESAGLINLQMYSEAPPRVEYNLTKDGRKLRQSLFTLSKYSSRKPEASKYLAVE